MELTLFPYPDDTVYTLPWVSYRKSGPYYLADSEEIEDYLPYLDGITYLRAIHDEALWDLMVQDSIKEILSILILDGFYDETDLPGALTGLGRLLSVFADHPLSLALQEEMHRREGGPLKTAARTVARWHGMRGCTMTARREEIIETMGPVDTCWEVYPSVIRNALQRLAEILRKSSCCFHGAYLHGSLASLDFVPGSSDLDLVYILRDDVAADPACLLETRRMMRETRSCFYAIDRFQHHGGYVLTPQMTSNYIECYLPLAAWRFARPILGPERLSFFVCESAFHRQMWFRRSVQYYRRQGCEGKKLTTVYEAKLLVSMATLLPSIAYTSLTGGYIGKKESLQWVEKAFPDRQIIAFIQELTRIRAERLCQGRTSEKEIRTTPDRSSHMTRELSESLSRETFLRVAYMCDRILGIFERERPAGPYHKHCNLPREAGRDAYEQIARKVSDTLSCLPGVTRVFLSGTIKTPGISDLDLVIVTEAQIPKETAVAISTVHSRLKEEDRALMMHPPMGIVPEQLLPYLPWIFPVHPDRMLWGPEPVFHALSPEAHLLLNLVQVTDFAVAMNGRLFQEMARRKEIDVRLLLNELGGLKYTSAMVEEAGGTRDSFQPFLASVEAMRSRWFETTRLHDLSDFLHQGARMVESVNRQIAALWQQQGFVSPESDSYRAPSTGADFFENIHETGWNIEKEEIIIRLPLLFGITLKHYAALDGTLSRFIRQHAAGKAIEQPGMAGEVLTTRAGFLNAHFEFLIRNGLRTGFFAPFHFGWRFDERE